MITLESLEREENKMTKNINEAKFVTVKNDRYEFVWAKVETNKWVENFYKIFDGESEHSHIHTVEYLTDDDVKEFATQLAELGWDIRLM